MNLCLEWWSTWMRYKYMVLHMYTNLLVHSCFSSSKKIREFILCFLFSHIILAVGHARDTIYYTIHIVPVSPKGFHITIVLNYIIIVHVTVMMLLCSHRDWRSHVWVWGDHLTILEWLIHPSSTHWETHEICTRVDYIKFPCLIAPPRAYGLPSAPARACTF